MKKIKASDVLELMPNIDLKKLREFKYIDWCTECRKILLYTHRPNYKPQQPNLMSLLDGRFETEFIKREHQEFYKYVKEIDFSEFEINTSQLIQVCTQFISDFELGCVLDGKIVGSPAVALVDLYNKFKQILETNEHEEN